MVLTLRDRKFIVNNKTLPESGEGELNSRIDYGLDQLFGVPSNGINDIAYNSGVIKNQIDSSNEKPLTYSRAIKLINNSNITSSFGFKPQELWKPQNDFTVQAHNLGIKVPYAPGATISRVNMNDVKPLQFDTTPKAPTPEEMQSLKTKVNEALPKPKGYGLAKLGRAAGIAMGAAQGAMGLWQMGSLIGEVSKARINPEEMLMKYGTSNTDIGGGVSYERQNNINTASEMDLIKAETNQATMGLAMSGASTGAAVGSLLGPVGGVVGGAIGGIAGAIGGLFGGASRRRKEEERLRRANILSNAITNENRDYAFTEKMQREVAKKYGNLEDLLLYAQQGVENVGNLFSRISKKDFLDTAFGKMFGEPNAMTSKGELIVHEDISNNGRNKFNVHEVKRGQNDTAPSYLTDNDTVIAEPLANIAKEAIRRDRQGVGNNEFDKVKIMLKNLRDSGILAMISSTPRRAKGDLRRMQRQLLPGYFLGKDWFGKVYNAIPAITGIGIGLQLYKQAANQDVYKPNSFKLNENKGVLRDMYKTHIDSFPIINEMKASQARTDRAIDNSLGLSTGQRATNKIASNLNVLGSIANAMTKLQEINNDYRTKANLASLEVGAQEAQRKLQAMQWDADTYAKGHAARLQGMQTGLYNILNALEQHFANVFKLNQFNKNMDLYNQELRLKDKEIQKMYDNKNVPESIRRPEEDYAYRVFLPELEIKPQLQVKKNALVAPSVNLRRGMRKNADVTNLLNALNHIYKGDKSFVQLLPDGTFGNNTYNAVKRFLKDYFANKPNWHTGVYGANTRSKLAEILKSLGGI